MPAVIGELLRGGLIDGNARSVSGRSVDGEYRECRASNARVIRALQAPLRDRAGFQVLSGNLFRSALIKTSVIGAAFRAKYLSDPAQPDVFRVRAVVFEGPEDYHARIDDPALAIDELCILVMRNCGPIAYPGSAEVAGGGLALLRDGDMIEIDLRRGSVNALIDDAELERRRTALTLPALTDQTAWQEIYRERVSALDEGATLRTRGEYTRVIERFGTPRNSH